MLGSRDIPLPYTQQHTRGVNFPLYEMANKRRKVQSLGPLRLSIAIRFAQAGWQSFWFCPSWFYANRLSSPVILHALFHSPAAPQSSWEWKVMQSGTGWWDRYVNLYGTARAAEWASLEWFAHLMHPDTCRRHDAWNCLCCPADVPERFENTTFNSHAALQLTFNFLLRCQNVC